MTPDPSPAVIAALAPTGRLRAAINLGNPVLAKRAAPDEAPSGVSVDLAQALAQALCRELDLQAFDAAALSVDAVRAGRADIGFFAIDPTRGAGIGFTGPYLLIEGAYLVPRASALQDNAQVDRAGIRVVVSKGSAYDLYLSRTLEAAQIVRAPAPSRVMETFRSEGADAAAGIRPQLEREAAAAPDLRLLPGRFMVIEQAMGLPAGRGAEAAQYLGAFVQWARSSGFVAQALRRHAIDGAVVA